MFVYDVLGRGGMVGVGCGREGSYVGVGCGWDGRNSWYDRSVVCDAINRETQYILAFNFV